MRLLEERVEIKAPVERVWDVLADFGEVSCWAPYMRTSHLIGEQQSGVGMRRGMRHAWGFRLEEVVTQWHQGKGFAFDVLKAPFPMKDVKEVWVLGPENGYTVVETQVLQMLRAGRLQPLRRDRLGIAGSDSGRRGHRAARDRRAAGHRVVRGSHGRRRRRD